MTVLCFAPHSPISRGLLWAGGYNYQINLFAALGTILPQPKFCADCVCRAE